MSAATSDFGNRMPAIPHDSLLFRYACAWVVATFLLLIAGGTVTSKGAGLAVPDWPTTYGENMFTYHPSKWVGNIFYEHGHRLIASGVGLMTIGMVVLLARREKRRWVRRLGYAALAAVCLQGTLGGLTVLFLLPAPISVAHAGLAQLFFCAAVTMALVQSPRWRRGFSGAALTPAVAARLRRWCIAAVAVVYVQIILGAVMRHTEAGLAIPDFPLAYGRVFPPVDEATIESINVDRRLGFDDLPPVTATQIVTHFVHRAHALLVAGIVLTAIFKTLRHARGLSHLSLPAWLLLALLPTQIGLGIATVLSQRHHVFNTAHVVVGAALLATGLVLTLRVIALQSRDRMSQTRLGGRPARAAGDIEAAAATAPGSEVREMQGAAS